jgi:hypothetical protein
MSQGPSGRGIIAEACSGCYIGQGESRRSAYGFHSKAQLALLTVKVTKARAPAQTAVKLRQKLETQVLQDTATMEALEAKARNTKAAANAASVESIAAQQAAKAHKTNTDAADYAAKQVHQTCNMRTSKKRRKKQSCVIPAGEANVNQ